MAKKRCILSIIVIVFILMCRLTTATASTVDNSAQYLVERALTEKSLGAFNEAYAAVLNVKDQNERDSLLMKLSTIADIVWNDDVKSLNEKLGKMAQSGSTQLYFETLEQIKNSNLSEGDKSYFHSELNSWSQNIGADCIAAVNAVLHAAEYFNEDAVHELDELFSVEKRAALAEGAINNVKNSESKAYLKKKLQIIRDKDSTFVKNKGITLGDIKLFDDIKKYDKASFLKYYSGKSPENLDYHDNGDYVGIGDIGGTFTLVIPRADNENRNDIITGVSYFSDRRFSPAINLKLLNLSIGDSEQKVLTTFGEPFERREDVFKLFEHEEEFNTITYHYIVKLIDELYEDIYISVEKSTKRVFGFAISVPDIQFNENNLIKTIIQNEPVSLPSEITVETAKGRTFKLPVKWDKIYIDTSKAGDYSITGRIALYAFQLKYQLKIELARTGWVKEGNTLHYYDSHGKMVTGWVKDNNKAYYMNDRGEMQTGWVKIAEKWYYFDESGVMKTGWLGLNNSWYYLNADGILATGWIYNNNKAYYMSKSGEMQIGWIQIGAKWYYFGQDGAMKTGWFSWNNKSYYFNEDGSMAVNADIGAYHIGSDGVAVKKKKAYSGKWHSAFLGYRTNPKDLTSQQYGVRPMDLELKDNQNVMIFTPLLGEDIVLYYSEEIFLGSIELQDYEAARVLIYYPDSDELFMKQKYYNGNIETIEFLRD